MNFTEEYSLICNEIISARRAIHQNPELSFEEYETAKIITDILFRHGIDYQCGIAKTGIVAHIGTKTDKVLLIRADMDALPVEENTALPYKSQKSGVMHACGHDIHTASALAAALILKKYENLLNGSVKIVFQPAEETTGGALPMIEEGVLSNPKVTCAIGGHVSPQFKVGKVKYRKGPLMASPDDFEIKFIGKSTHGAEPQNGISPIIPASEFVCKTSVIGDELKKNGDNVLSVCTIISDGNTNIIPDTAVVKGTFRTFDEESRHNAAKLLEDEAMTIAQKHGASIEFKYNFMYPPLINDDKITELLVQTAANAIGNENISEFEKPLMTGEDFSYFAKNVPAVFFWYGANGGSDAPLHSSKFVADEGAIEVCANLFCNFALKYLE